MAHRETWESEEGNIIIFIQHIDMSSLYCPASKHSQGGKETNNLFQPPDRRREVKLPNPIYSDYPQKVKVFV